MVTCTYVFHFIFKMKFILALPYTHTLIKKPDFNANFLN